MQLTPEILRMLKAPPKWHNVFVFGSNRRGIHGAGAALYAYRNCGAIRGQGEGLQGSSYAIPTKEGPYDDGLSLTEIQDHVDRFMGFAKEHLESHLFFLTPIGTGRAGHRVSHIAPMFQEAPPNVLVPYVFSRYYEPKRLSAWDHTETLR